jgi:hypothetical protein
MSGPMFAQIPKTDIRLINAVTGKVESDQTSCPVRRKDELTAAVKRYKQ